jgi:hypothetical protein
MRKAIYFAWASTLVLAGCGNSSVSLGSSSSLGTGGGTSTGTGGAGGADCVMASISVDGDGATNHFGAACKGSYGAAHTTHANGYLGFPGADSGLTEQVFVNGCANSTAPPMFGSLSLMAPQPGVGSATMGTASYANGTDTFTTDTAVMLTVTELDGLVVKGSYTATVSSTNNGVKMLSGTFSVCRVPDFLPP